MLTTFPTLASGDLTVTYRFVKEYCDRHFPSLHYKVLQTPATAVIDEIHDEVPEYGKVWAPEIQLRSYVLPAEQTHPITVFGIEELRDAVLFVSVPSLIEAGLATVDAVTREVTLTAQVGDRFFYTATAEYDVLEWRKAQVFANTDIPILFQANAEKVRREASTYSG